MRMQGTLHAMSDTDSVALVADDATAWLNHVRAQPDAQISLRFAAAMSGDTPCLVFGLRVQGKGIDVLVPTAQCGCVRTAPLFLEVQAADGVSASVPWDETSFTAFLDHVEEMIVALPEHPIWRALYDVFGD